MEKTPYLAIGQRLTELIQGTPMEKETQRELAKRFGVSVATVNHWMKGIKGPTMNHAIMLATELNCCVEYLLTGRGPKTPIPDNPLATEITLSIVGLTPAAKAELEAEMRALLNKVNCGDIHLRLPWDGQDRRLPTPRRGGGGGGKAAP